MPALPTARTALKTLEILAADWLPLPPLDPSTYARLHAAFEARSDQRRMLTEWLCRRLAPRASRTTRVVSIGCGDGSVDVAVAQTLAARGSAVSYVGIEPHAPSASLFRERLATVPGVTVDVTAKPSRGLADDGPADVVLAVQSLYYVPDLAAEVRDAWSLVAPAGELVVLHAPLEPLNALAQVLAPGPRHPWSAEVFSELSAMGRVRRERLSASIDLNEVNPGVLDFTVQAVLPPPLRAQVLRVLQASARTGAGLLLPHPVDAFVLERPSV